MANKVFQRLLFSLLFVLSTVNALGQGGSIKSLQDDILSTQQEIEYNTKLLEKTRSDQKANATQLKLIRSRIDNRQKIVSLLDEQIALIDRDISDRNTNVVKLDIKKQQLQSEYSRFIYESYKNYKQNNFLLFLFASDDFNDASRRVNFMRRYNHTMEMKVAEIDSISISVNRQITELDQQRIEVAQKREERTKEVASLGKDKKQYEKSSAELTLSERSLGKELAAKRAAMKRAQQQISNIMAQEARKSGATKRTTAQTDADVKLSGMFDQNRGRLPYPIRGGVIQDRFGVHTHLRDKTMLVDNPGVHIAGEKGQQVHCVFQGTVTKVMPLGSLKTGVLVRIGDYGIMYANLATVSVKVGDVVSLNQVLGTIPAGDDPDDHMVSFVICKGETRLDPEQWLRR